MFIKIPVYWSEENEDLGLNKDKYSTGEITISSDHICAHHADDNGELTLRLTNGEIFRSPLEYKQFEKEYPELMARLELIIATDTNVQ